MIRVALQLGADLDGFRRALRGLVAAGARPEDVVWEAGEAALFGGDALPDGPPVALPRKAAALIELVVCHRDPERYALLHRLAWRILNGERMLLEIASDPLVHRLNLMAKAIRRDLHKMHAFVRFRETTGPDGEERFIAWFEPDHFILEATADFFIDRFRSLHWTILTPIGSLIWDRRTLTLGPPGRKADALVHDDFEQGWGVYYESVFNPARVNPTMMRAEMPKRYWRNLPEAGLIPNLIRSAPQRVREMIDREAAMPTKRNPDKAVAAMTDQAPKSMAELNRLIAADEPAEAGVGRAVFGEGPEEADVVLVGEQPGDQEDIQGRPFVGPAGKLLRRAMDEAGLDAQQTYITNAVKRFHFKPTGKKRLHRTPTAGEVSHDRWWLAEELKLVKPKLVVALGATAVLALNGKAIPVMKNRGPAQFGERRGYITVHPSYLLRLPDAAAKAEGWKAFVADLERVKAAA